MGLEIERRIDRGEPAIATSTRDAKTFGDLVQPHLDDLREVGKRIGRSKAASLAFLGRTLGRLRLPELDRERLIQIGKERAREGAGPFDVILVHSFSRFFRDQLQLEFYVRRLAKNGVRLVSITRELGDDPMSNMIRQIMALFDEYQSKENAKHTLRAMKENARQGFWNGSLPPVGYRIVEAAEQHGHRTKKILEIDPIQAVGQG